MRQIEPGEIYLIDTTSTYKGYGEKELFITTERVVFFDEFWVFVDLRYDGERWEMDKLRRGLVYFAPRGRNWFDSSPLKLGFSEVSEELHRWFCTDLILRIGRDKALSWNSSVFENRNSLEQHLSRTQTDYWLSETIKAEKIYLIPYGKGGTPKPPVLIHAENGKEFSTAEIVWEASVIQREVYMYASNGIGIFRAGSKGGVATYYIGEFFDRAGILKYYEDNGIDTSARPR